MSFTFEVPGFMVGEKEEGVGEYDLVIVGAGPAGLTAAIYAARYALKTVILSRDVGGLTAVAGLIENYPGFKAIEGSELINRMMEQVSEYGVNVVLKTVTDITREGDLFKVRCSDGSEYLGRTVLLAVGAERRKLGLPNEERLVGRGVSYCATCDAPMFRGRRVAVVGGGDTAVKEALHVADFASKVYIIHRRDKFRAEPVLVERLYSKPNVEFLLKRRIKAILGDDRLTGLLLDDGTKLSVEGLFVAIGLEPPSSFFRKIGLKVDEEGYVVVGPDQMTSIEGILAAGDCTTASNKFRQTLTAAAEGAIAADTAYKYILNKFGEPLGST